MYEASKIGRRRALQRLVAAVAATALPGLIPARARALALPTEPRRSGPGQPTGGAGAATWEQPGPDLAFTRLFAPASGALFGLTHAELYRSDDAGTSWRAVPLPPTRLTQRVAIVDPLDHRVLYADSDDGLQRSEDEGATWTTILASSRATIRVAVSPADPSLLYVAQSGWPGSPADFWFFRSRDRGVTWDQLEEAHNSLCFWNAPILAPHPTDPARLFRTAGCYAGRDFGDSLAESRDQAQSWRSILQPKNAFPRALVGGAGADPARYYLAANRDSRSGGSLLFTSADDAATWTETLSFAGGGTMQQADQPSITIGGLTYDPATPSRVFVGLQRRTGTSRTVESSSVSASDDGGATWTTLGQDGLPDIRDLVLGIDGLNLFAATQHGVWRLALA